MTDATNIDLVLVDFDDTLVDTAPRFERARRQLFERMEALGFERGYVEHVHHHEVDPPLRAEYGLGPQRMVPAFVGTYEALCRHAGVELDVEQMDIVRSFGAAVAGTPPPIEGAMDALRRLATSLPTVVYTQASDLHYQLGCLRDAGAIDAVGEDRVRVVPLKTPDVLRETLAEFDVSDPTRAWMVGNSIRSDINPALEVGVRAVLVEVEDPWQHDVVEPLHNGFPRVGAFREAVSLLLDGRDHRGGRQVE
jgi:putative hydrolase of the HAD superfamily